MLEEWPLGRAAAMAAVSGGADCGEPRERAQVLDGLVARLPPLPLATDALREPDLECGVEGLVGVGEHAAEQPVDLIGGHRK